MNILCPVCQKTLKIKDRSYVCEDGHCFDIAKEGYLNLNLHDSTNTGDNPEMMKARREFLEKNYYSFMKEKVDEQIKENDSLIDLACGEGYYTSYFKAKDKIGIDLSKSGLKYASKKDKGTLYLLNSIFHNPLEDACADVITTIFAPIAKEEIVRLLKDNGRFILVKPDVYHLYELKEKIYENPYLNEIENIDIPGLKLVDEMHISQKHILNNEDLSNLFTMTPYYHKTSIADKEKLRHISKLEVSFCFIIDIYEK